MSLQKKIFLIFLFTVVLLFENSTQSDFTSNETKPLETSKQALPTSTQLETIYEKSEENDEDKEEVSTLASVDRKTVVLYSEKASKDAENENDDAKSNEEGDEEGDEEGNEEGDEEGDEEESNCDGRLSTFVRTFDGSAFFPDDYELLSERFKRQGPYGHHRKIEDTLETLNRGQKLAQTLLLENKDLKDTVMYVSSVMSDKLYEAEISPQCTADLVAIGSGLRDFQPWAFKFFDSMGTYLVYGLLHGHFSHFGQFDQCVEVASPLQESGRTVYGKYCSLQFAAITPPIESYDAYRDEETFKENPIWKQIMEVTSKFNIDKYLHKNISLFISQATDKVDDNIYHVGVCLPTSCSGEEVAKFINAFIYPLTKMAVRIPEALCEPNVQLKEVKLGEKHQLIAVYTISILFGVVIFCTLFDCFFIFLKNKKKITLLPVTIITNGNNEENNKYENEKEFPKSEQALVEQPKREPLYEQILKCFSLIENFNQLITRKADQHYYTSIDTLRVLLSVLVFPVNSLGLYLMYYPQLYRNADGMTRQEMLSVDHWSSWVPGLGFEGLIFLFALCTTLQQFKILDKYSGDFIYFQYLIGRWLRLAPVLFGSILVIYLLPLTGKGPMWFFNEQYVVAPCKSVSSLLSTFLYYSNWNDPLDEYTTRSTLNICNPESWLFSAFNQLYLFAPLLFLPLYHWPKFGLAICSLVLLVFGPLLTTLPRLLTGYPSFIEPTKFISFANNPQAITHYHMSPLMYVSALSAGILTGYAILKRAKSNFFAGKVGETILWLLSLASVALIFVWQSTFKVVNKDVSTTSVTVFFAYYKLAWSVFLAYTVYIACTRPNSLLARLLHRPSLMPFAKLTTSIYLLRSPVLFYRKTSSRTTEEIYHYKSFQNVLADYLLTAFFALLLHLLFEAPTLRLLAKFNFPETEKKSAEIQENDQDSLKVANNKIDEKMIN